MCPCSARRRAGGARRRSVRAGDPALTAYLRACARYNPPVLGGHMRKVLAAVAAMELWISLLVAGQAPAHRFGLDDFSHVARVADPQIAPDGKSIAVVIS